MSQLNVDTLGSQTGTTISVASGHTLQDANGKTIAGNKIVLLNTTTISNDATVSIDNFVDPNTYVYYKVIGENIKPATDGQQFRYYFRTGVYLVQILQQITVFLVIHLVG